jgi:hypothetical protein
MSIGLLFWFIWLIALLFGLWSEYVTGQPYPYKRGFGWFLMFVLTGLLGWKTFGPLVQ